MMRHRWVQRPRKRFWPDSWMLRAISVLSAILFVVMVTFCVLWTLNFESSRDRGLALVSVGIFSILGGIVQRLIPPHDPAALKTSYGWVRPGRRALAFSLFGAGWVIDGTGSLVGAAQLGFAAVVPVVGGLIAFITSYDPNPPHPGGRAV